MKKYLFVSPKGEFELNMSSLLGRIFWWLFTKRKITYKFYEAPKEMRGREYKGVIIDEFITQK